LSGSKSLLLTGAKNHTETTKPAFHRIQRVFARATEAIGFRELSAALGGFLLLLFFARQRKVKGKSRLIWCDPRNCRIFVRVKVTGAVLYQSA
jgi:hypothetical protein